MQHFCGVCSDLETFTQQNIKAEIGDFFSKPLTKIKASVGREDGKGSPKWYSTAQLKPIFLDISHEGESPVSPAVQGCSKIWQVFQRHSFFSWYSDIHECRALPLTVQPTGIPGISPSPCPRFLQTKKSESPKVVVSSQEKVSSSHEPIEPHSQLFKHRVTGSYWSREPCGHGPRQDRESSMCTRGGRWWCSSKRIS